MDCIELRLAFALDNEAIDEADSAPDLTAVVKYEPTFEDRTAAHWARPTVPPRDRNYIG